MSEHATFHIDGASYEVVALRGREALGEPFELELRCATAGDAPSPQALLGRGAVVDLAAAGGTRTLAGIVARAVRSVGDDGRGELCVTVRPRCFLLTLGENCRTFRDVSVVDIASIVLAGVPHRFELVSDYRKRDYCAQYREDDWSFLSRLCEEEGIHLWFDHQDGSSLVLGDASIAAADLAGGAPLAFAAASGLDSDREIVCELFAEARAVPGRFALRSFDPQRPALRLDAGAGAGGSEDYDAVGAGPRDPAACARRVELQREAAACAARTVRGASNSVRLAPGRALELGGHAVGRYDGRYFVIEASHELVQRRRGSSDGGPSYQCQFVAIPAALPFRPPVRTPQPRQAGLQSGVVIGRGGEEIDTDASGRVRVQLHWDREGRRDERSGHWMRVAQRGTASSLLLPRIGWSVLGFNEEGSVDEPSVLSRIHDAEHPPSHALPGNQTRVVFRTATSPGDGSSNELHFEDSLGGEVMFLNASRDMNVLVNDQQAWQVRRDHARQIAGDHRLSVGTDEKEAVGGNQSVTVAGDDALTVLGSRSKAVSGDEHETIGGDRALHVGAAHATVVGGHRDLEVGAVLIDATLGPISCSSGMATNILVGGAVVKLTGDAMSESADLGMLQTVGGVKLELVKGKRTIKAKQIHTESVGGAMVLKTDGKWSSKTTVATTVTAGAALTVDAPTLDVQASAKIVLRCGGSSLTITPSDVEIVAPAFTLDDATLLDALSGRIDHN